MRHLSQQLFELARLEHGGIKPQRERFAMGELISDVAQSLSSRRARELQLQIDVPGLPLVYADVSMIERVVTNLLDNAIRHTPPAARSVSPYGRRMKSYRLRWPIQEPVWMPRCAICSSGLQR